jgi:hypothetical protein
MEESLKGEPKNYPGVLQSYVTYDTLPGRQLCVVTIIQRFQLGYWKALQ